MVTEMQKAMVAAFLEGMYYAGKLPGKAEVREITHYLHKLYGITRVALVVVVQEQLEALHLRVANEEQ